MPTLNSSATARLRTRSSDPATMSVGQWISPKRPKSLSRVRFDWRWNASPPRRTPMARIRATISRSKARAGCSDLDREERLNPLKELLASFAAADFRWDCCVASAREDVATRTSARTLSGANRVISGATYPPSENPMSTKRGGASAIARRDGNNPGRGPREYIWAAGGLCNRADPSSHGKECAVMDQHRDPRTTRKEARTVPPTVGGSI